MPVYNEDVARVFSGVHAIRECLGGDRGFDFYILSDSTNPANWVAEELEWQTPARRAGRKQRGSSIATVIAISVARAATSRTSARTGAQLYDYMVILDADSLMTRQDADAVWSG